MSVSALTPRGNASRFIVVEGPIGVGKTALAERLAASFSADLMLEDVAANPFLERFYEEGRSAALPAQMFFLFARARQIEELRQSDLFTDVRIADYLYSKDRLFAELNLDADELSLYNQVVDNLKVEPPTPDLVIYLQASVDALMERISRRGRNGEHHIDRGYLEQVCEAYSRFFHTYDDGPLLIVNASQIDPISNDDDYGQLFQMIERTNGGRHFFNPATAALA